MKRPLYSLFGMTRYTSWFFLCVCLWVGYVSQADAQCVMCRTQVESTLDQKEGRHAAEGINRGILYLLFVPYLSMGVLAYMWYRRAKRAAALRQGKNMPQRRSAAAFLARGPT